jgi:hypothetical protein
VATGLLVALLSVFATATPVAHEADALARHTVAMTVVSTAAPTLPAPHSAPELPVAGAGTPLPPRAAPRTTHVAHAAEAHPRAHRRPAADRAPPARA